MNIQDAIKHCRQNPQDGFKLPNDDGGFVTTVHFFRLFYKGDDGKNHIIHGESGIFTQEDILSDNWQIVPNVFA